MTPKELAVACGLQTDVARVVLTELSSVEPVATPDVERPSVRGAAFERARDWLRKRWCQEWPNEAHCRQLADYEAHVLGSKSVEPREGMREALASAREYVVDALDAHEHSDGRDLLARIDAALHPGDPS